MGQTRMFRDRVVSMEQTLEGGEKHLPLLKDLCREALPGFEYAEHALDHERDLFVMELRGPDGSAKKIAWTRMVLFDAERIPTLTGDPAAVLRGKIVDFLKAHAARTEIVVTFRHLEEGWIDTPEPRREGGGRRRRRGGRGGGRGGERGQERRPGAPPSAASGGERRSVGPRPPSAGPRQPSGGPRPPSGGPRPPSAGSRPPSAGPRPASGAAAAGPQRSGGRPPMPASAASGAGGSGGSGEGAAEGAAGKRRRRFRRRRRGGRGPGGGGNPGASGPPNPGGGGAPRP
ncbi:MAG: hypothetical protein ABW056_06150 [Thermoanaerobaculia bacterium]